MQRIFYILLVILFVASAFGLGWYFREAQNSVEIISPIEIIKPKPLDKYTIENLSNAKIPPGILTIKETIKEEKDYNSYLFELTFNPNLDGKTIKKTTGQLNIPKNTEASGTVIMFRGYINQETFKTGDGTRNAAGYFAENDFITIAPDFLGYSGSDPEARNIFETRFQSYVTALSLLKTLESLPDKPELIQLSELVDSNNAGLPDILITRLPLFIWGHSNGGQIALTLLEITGKAIPTTLWAPVSKPFPYSVLYYTDESEDRGKLIRRELAKFEEGYNPDLYSLDLYLDKINAPLQIHQGTADESVPENWSRSLTSKLKNLEKDFEYYTYSGVDHNMRPSWNTVVERDINFFKSSTQY